MTFLSYRTNIRTGGKSNLLKSTNSISVNFFYKTLFLVNLLTNAERRIHYYKLSSLPTEEEEGEGDVLLNFSRFQVLETERREGGMERRGGGRGGEGPFLHERGRSCFTSEARGGEGLGRSRKNANHLN